MKGPILFVLDTFTTIQIVTLGYQSGSLRYMVTILQSIYKDTKLHK